MKDCALLFCHLLTRHIKYGTLKKKKKKTVLTRCIRNYGFVIKAISDRIGSFHIVKRWCREEVKGSAISFGRKSNNIGERSGRGRR